MFLRIIKTHFNDKILVLVQQTKYNIDYHKDLVYMVTYHEGLVFIFKTTQ